MEINKFRECLIDIVTHNFCLKNIGTRVVDLYSPNLEPYGKNFAKWAELWIKWVLSIPKMYNPAADLTGEHWNQNQNGPVLFLAGTFGGFARRQCSIPAGKAIFFPVVTKECSFAEDYDLKTEKELIKRVKQFIDCVTRMEVVVDGAQLQDLRKYRVHSGIFDLVFPENNVYDVEPGPTKSVTDGYWVFLKGLSTGQHRLYFSAEVSLPERSKIVEFARRYNKIKGTIFRTEASYEITVKSKGLLN
jgi:hypothetical protein